jgi:hypothetical protein
LVKEGFPGGAPFDLIVDSALERTKPDAAGPAKS